MSDSSAHSNLGASSGVQPAMVAQELMQYLISKPPHLALRAMLDSVGRQLHLNAVMLGSLKIDQSLDTISIWRTGSEKTIATSPEGTEGWLQHPLVQQTLATGIQVVLPLTSDPLTASVSPLPPPFLEPAAPLARLLPEGLQTALVARTQYRGRTNGILFLFRAQPHPWTETEMHVLQALSNQAAIAVSQINLEQQVEQQFQQQSLIYQLVGAIREGWELERVFELATEGLVKLLQLSSGFVLSFKYVDPQFKGRINEGVPRTRATVEALYFANEAVTALHEASLPAKSSSWLRHSFQISDCAIGHRVLTGVEHSLTIPAMGLSQDDKNLEASLAGMAIAPLFDLGRMPAVLVMPLENQGVGLGCLVLQHTQLRFWQPDELALARLVASHISTAMIQSNTLRKVQGLVEERTSQLRHSLDVQAKLYEKTRQQVEQLQRMNRVMEDFLSTVSHELLTPLTSMKMAIRMLREAPLSEVQRDRYLSILDNQCSQETHLIQDLLTIQRIESNAITTQLHQVDLHYVIRDLHQVWQETLSKKQLALIPSLPERSILMRTDPESLHRILTELLTNAQKYSHPGTTIDLQIALLSNQSIPHVSLRIENTGIGIFPDEVPLIFEKFRRGQEALRNTIPGIGLGLALARGLAAHLNGAIAVTSDPITGQEAWRNCFTLTLPLSPELLR